MAYGSLFLLLVTCSLFGNAVKYPNEIEETPTVICEKDQIVVKIKTSSSNPSLIYADDFGEDPECSTRNRNLIEIKHGKCGMSTERTEDPMGAVQRVCISVQLHPMFVTEADRSYCVQCVYVEQHVLKDFEQSLDVSEAPATELAPQFDFQTVPKCVYSIRKGSPTGPPAHYAVIGDAVYHVWQCDGNNHGILVQNCYVEDGQGNRILIIDQDGFETHVFKFAQKTVTRFACQIRICVQGEDCHRLAPPKQCPSSSERNAAAAVVVSSTAAAEAATNADDAAVESATTGSEQNGYGEDKEDLGVEEEESVEEGYRRKVQGVTTFERPLSPNATIGTVYFGGDLRARRDVLPGGKKSTSNVVRRSPAGYPEMDITSEIRVLDSPEDVQYYERALNKNTVADSITDMSCISGLTYTVLVSSLVLLSMLLMVISIFLLIKNSGYRKRIVHFAN
ncbi:cutl-5 [Pristionchus pacificus]|uniref:Cutl-5 n=1 Tax=Pristionchus pacificus TaxID=54126 RepID=A0A2A6CTA8_PRIPA|nr:cutl-5 [Pristionchus pacificus]|eukprot:PDM81464.1 cutl-5 [Pristionchus pacificus]